MIMHFLCRTVANELQHVNIKRVDKNSYVNITLTAIKADMTDLVENEKKRVKMYKSWCGPGTEVGIVSPLIYYWVIFV